MLCTNSAARKIAKKFKKRAKKKIIKKRKHKNYSKKKSNGADIDLQKVVDFKFQTLGKIYKNFTAKREKEKGKKEKLKEKNREKQIKEQQKQLKEEEKQLKKEEQNRLKEINFIRIEQERKRKEEIDKEKLLTCCWVSGLEMKREDSCI